MTLYQMKFIHRKQCITESALGLPSVKKISLEMVIGQEIKEERHVKVINACYM